MYNIFETLWTRQRYHGFAFQAHAPRRQTTRWQTVCDLVPNEPGYTISVAYLGLSTTDVCNRFAEKSTLFLASTKCSRRHRQRRSLQLLYTDRCDCRTDRPTLSLPTLNGPDATTTSSKLHLHVSFVFRYDFHLTSVLPTPSFAFQFHIRCTCLLEAL